MPCSARNTAALTVDLAGRIVAFAFERAGYRMAVIGSSRFGCQNLYRFPLDAAVGTEQPSDVTVLLNRFSVQSIRFLLLRKIKY
jgi:hypothetical protein